MAWYSTGSITATNNSGAITGVGTLFMANVRAGDGITIAGSTSVHEVVNVTSDTQLTVSPVYAGTTGSGKSFGVVPVQGYTKGLADQAKSLLLSFSSIGSSPSVAALAGITGTADMIPYFTSGTTMWTTPISATARSLLDDTTIAAMRTTLGLKTAAVADVLGTVSQSAGVPTGAIMESGTNANGSYIKYADGTLLCWNGNGQSTASIPINNSTTTTYCTFPTSFINTAFTLSVQVWPGGNWAFYGVIATGANGVNSGAFVVSNGGYGAQAFSYRWMATGRWY